MIAIKVGVRILVFGRVQGVGYRFFTKETATLLGITGFVENLPDGTVFIEAHGDKEIVDNFISKLKKGPSYAVVTELKVDKIDYRNDISHFFIRG